MGYTNQKNSDIIINNKENGVTMTREEYIKWINDPANEFNCTPCPHNEGRGDGKPCGQQNCWVTCHLRRV